MTKAKCRRSGAPSEPGTREATYYRSLATGTAEAPGAVGLSGEAACCRRRPHAQNQAGRSHPQGRSKVLENPFAPQKPGRRSTLSPPVPLLHPLQTKLNIKPSDKREIFTGLRLPTPGPRGLATCQWGLTGTLGRTVLSSGPIFLFHIWNEIINIKNYFLMYSVAFSLFRGSGK